MYLTLATSNTSSEHSTACALEREGGGKRERAGERDGTRALEAYLNFAASNTSSENSAVCKLYIYIEREHAPLEAYLTLATSNTSP